MTTKEKQREAKPMSPEARPAHRHCDYATRVQVHLAKHAVALALIQKTLAQITDPARTYQSSEVYALINKRIEHDRTFFDALRRLGFAGQSGFGSLTPRDAGAAFAAAVKREYGGKPTKRERTLAIQRLMDKLDVATSRLLEATARIADLSTPAISSGSPVLRGRRDDAGPTTQPSVSR